MIHENVGIASESDVLRQQISETRGALGEKLELLEEKVAETVQTATASVAEATASVAEATASVVESVQNATESVTETVGNVHEVVQGTVESVRSSVSGSIRAMKESLDLSRAMQRHPWSTLAGAVVVGFIGGKLMEKSADGKRFPGQADGYGPGQSASGVWASPSTSLAQGMGYGSASTDVTSSVERREPAQTAQSASPRASQPRSGWASELKDALQGELGRFAVGASLGVLRELISQSVTPKMKHHVHESDE